MKRIRIDGLWSELRRRHVVRVGLWYLALAVATIQVGDVLLGAFQRGQLMPWLIAAVVAGFPLALSLSWFFDLTPQGIERTAPVETDEPRRGLAITDDHVSLVVLRFQALSNDMDDKLLASGISSEVIGLVTPVPNIRVSSRDMSFLWDGDAAGARVAAEQFNASFVVTGSLQRAGERIRVIADLTDTRSDARVWSHTYERRIEDVFEVQHDIARSIVGALLGQVRLAETQFARNLPENALDAWGLLQKAYWFWLANFSIEGMLQAIEYLRRAIELAPDYAAPRAALAMLQAQLLTSRVCADYDATAREAAEMIEQAWRLAPNDVDVLENAGVVWQNLGQSERAIAALRHGIELAPLNLIARGYLALTLAFTCGEAGAREARDLLEENFRIAPKHPSAPYWRFFQAVAEQGLGNYPRSIELCTLSLQGQPGWIHNYFFRANARCLLGDVQAARLDLEAAARVNPLLSPPLYLDNVLRITGSETAADPFVRGLLQAGLIESAKC